MSDRDFDVDRLAAYLYLSPQQVGKMADRGQLPGRRIGGEWRFSPEEIHHWLEERIGASDQAELVEVEGVLERHAEDQEGPPELHKLLLPAAIAIPLAAKTSNSVINAMVQLAGETGVLWDPDKMAEAVRVRETLHPTALDNGVAMLHPRRPLPTILAQPLLALGLTWQGIPFGGSKGVLTDVFFSICSMDDAEHLRILARLSRLLSSDGFLQSLREFTEPAAVIALVRECEEGLN